MFQGFSDETFEFFMAIRFNNNRDFFHQNHDWYVRGVRGPALELAKALSSAVEELDPALERRCDKVVSRINRDIRFSNDKSPYRDYIWLSFHPATEAKPGLYFDIGTQGADYGMGIYYDNRPLMNGFRRALLADPARFAEIWAPLQAEFHLHGNILKRMKVPDDLPEILRPWYPLKGFYIEKEISDFDLIKSPRLAEEIASGIQRFAPLYRYFLEIEPITED